MRRAVSVIAVTVVAVALLAAPARAATPPLPNSMAALGDSITRAFDVCCYYGDHPSNSWATGGSPLDSIQSHYERLRALDPAIEGHQFNDAVTGAKMSDGARQAGQAVAQGAKYVTILLGANDLCTSSVSTMTWTASASWRRPPGPPLGGRAACRGRPAPGRIQSRAERPGDPIEERYGAGRAQAR